ncbi:MAG: DoxX family protein [Terracidiphilus sp.]|nr:DoxX family protein [Terracidiphilus sp.]
MNRYALIGARLLVSVVFLLNGFGIIDQSIPAHELVERGAPVALVPPIMLAGRVLEIVSGFALALGVFPQLAALALLGFLIPATFVSHSFWETWGTAAFMVQIINFFKNAAIWGGLLFIAASDAQPATVPLSKLHRIVSNLLRRSR